jgi:uroporphyrinogen decarboxylase
MTHLYLDTIYKKPVHRTPIWIMRQAGRYLPEYRKLREKYDFITLCKTPEIAAEITMQPIKRFQFDAAILFSDILVVPEALGLTLDFIEDQGPLLFPQVLNKNGLKKLTLNRLETKLNFVYQAIVLIQAELDGKIPLIGFSGSPFTLAVYMVEGKPTKYFKYIKQMLYTKEQDLADLLDLLTEAVTQYLVMQIKAGVNAIQIFDSWGGILPPHLYHQYSVQYLQKIVCELNHYHVPVTIFCRGGMDSARLLTRCDINMIGIDWTIDLLQAKNEFGKNFSLQGNLDPAVLYGAKETIKKEVAQLLNIYKSESGHVFNLGHGILPDTPLDHVHFLVDEVRRQSSILKGE